MNLTALMRTKRLFFDGGTGTLLQAQGLPSGTPPEAWNFTHPEKVTALHKAYLEAGCHIIKTNTFGINSLKYPDYREQIAAAFACAKAAVSGREDVFVAYDLGPTGRLLSPLGDLGFEEAVGIFARNVREAVRHGASLILIETMTDSYETKAAVLAAKENCDLPVFVTCAYGEDGKLMSGATPEVMVAMLEGLGVDALGLNCSFGPEQAVALLPRFAACASVPLIVNPNASLPEMLPDGTCRYDMTPQAFAACGKKLAEEGAALLGGCCGTTPAHIRALISVTADIPLPTTTPKQTTTVTSGCAMVTLDGDPKLIGERINPTGKPRVKEALRCDDMDYLIEEGIRQADAGAHILDVNVGLPGIDEPRMLQKAVAALQAAVRLPLQLDSSDPQALAQAMRIYNGKPMVNSVCGKQESMHSIFPLLRKYGGVAVALAMDEDGIPPSAEGRVAIIRRILDCAATYGIRPTDIVADPLTLAVSSDPNSAAVTLEAVRQLHEMGVRTVLGVSNVSFGLPAREKVNAAFWSAALASGLDAAIINVLSRPMMDAYYAYRVLHRLDPACADYIRYASEKAETGKNPPQNAAFSLRQAVFRGLKGEAVRLARAALQTTRPLSVLSEEIIPALNDAGRDFGEQRIFLPQLLLCAEAAMAAFDTLKRSMPATAAQTDKAVVLATVQGDIHDIGKNIVKTLLESYGFVVYDLGRDVPPAQVLDCVLAHGCKLVGLSALMTTTLPAMAETVALLHREAPGTRVIVGGAVLTQEYADSIGADFYAATAVDTANYVQAFYADSPDAAE